MGNQGSKSTRRKIACGVSLGAGMFDSLLGCRGVSFAFSPSSTRHCWEINTYARAHLSIITTYRSYIILPSRFGCAILTPTSSPWINNPPYSHAPGCPRRAPSEARSCLVVPLPQRPIPFEVVPIYYATNHGRRQRICPFMYTLYSVSVFEHLDGMEMGRRKGLCIFCEQYRLCQP